MKTENGQKIIFFTSSFQTPDCGGKLRDHIRRIALLCGTLDKSQAANIQRVFFRMSFQILPPHSVYE